MYRYNTFPLKFDRRDLHVFFQLEHTDSTSRCFVFEKQAERLKNATAWVPTKRSSTALITTRQRSTYYCIAIN